MGARPSRPCALGPAHGPDVREGFVLLGAAKGGGAAGSAGTRLPGEPGHGRSGLGPRCCKNSGFASLCCFVVVFIFAGQVTHTARGCASVGLGGSIGLGCLCPVPGSRSEVCSLCLHSIPNSQWTSRNCIFILNLAIWVKTASYRECWQLKCAKIVPCGDLTEQLVMKWVGVYAPRCKSLITSTRAYCCLFVSLSLANLNQYLCGPTTPEPSRRLVAAAVSCQCCSETRRTVQVLRI